MIDVVDLVGQEIEIIKVYPNTDGTLAILLVARNDIKHGQAGLNLKLDFPIARILYKLLKPFFNEKDN